MEKPVIFRKNSDGEILAIFPSMPGTLGADSCLAYSAQNKKHSVKLDVMRTTIQASLVESLQLLQDVVHEGFYPLHPRQRVKAAFHRERQKAMSNSLPVKLPRAAEGKTKRGRGRPKTIVHKKRPNRWLEGLAA